MADALASAWQDAQSSGDYSGLAAMLDGMSAGQLMQAYGLSPQDVAYVNEKTGANISATPQEAQKLLWDTLEADPNAKYSDILSVAQNLGLDKAATDTAYQNVINQAFQQQGGRNIEDQNMADAMYYLQNNVGSLDQGMQLLNNSQEGYNYDTQDVISAFRQALGRNPTQQEYAAAMAQLGTGNFDRSTLGNGNFTSAVVASLESDPYAGRYAGFNPYALPSDAVNVSTNTLGDAVQYVSPVTQRPVVTSFENGQLVVRDGADTLTGDDAATAIGLAMATGGMNSADYRTLQSDLRNAKSMDDIYAAFSKPQAVAALEPIFGFETGVGKTLAEAQANSVGIADIVARLAAANGGQMPSLSEVSKAANAAGIKYQFDQALYNQLYANDRPAVKSDVITPQNFNQKFAQIQNGVTQFKTVDPSLATAGPGTSKWGGWKDRTVVYPSPAQLMGAGDAEYQSPLIKALRQSSLQTLSNNPGVQIAPNVGADKSTWTAPTNTNSAFSPDVLSSRAASTQEVNDWNGYNTYRTNSVSASKPYLSFNDWVAGGKPTGVPSETTSGTSATGTTDTSGGGDGSSAGGPSAGGDSSSSGASSGGDGSSSGGDGGSGGGDGGAAYATGGLVTSKRLKGSDPKGPDDGYAALDEGEFVLTKDAIKKLGPIGVEVLKRLNAKDKR